MHLFIAQWIVAAQLIRDPQLLLIAPDKGVTQGALSDITMKTGGEELVGVCQLVLQDGRQIRLNIIQRSVSSDGGAEVLAGLA
ncbi:MAG: hypothetical protein LPD71_14880 [Shewanella sp.]|nr:hypothetical protein [Shewanella sp.]MCF1432061.1 hypothetical protein [Shewanella sp.]MCF1439970.1 hypothetical protein [Shewanella sp.]MCF1456918.1 hypothetical protein [Shewanella sp.]